MTKLVIVGKPRMKDVRSVEDLLSEWFDWNPAKGRLESIRRSIRNKELLVSRVSDKVVGFIHYVLHEDIIDGGPNSFISAFYVSRRHRGRGIGTALLEGAIRDSLKRGAIGIETSTIHSRARKLYERHHFKQTIGDIGEVFLELDVDEYLHPKEPKRKP